jgi:outer membrane protein assembly factor BamB
MAISPLILESLAAQSPRASDEPPPSLFPVRTVWTLALNNSLIAPPAYSASHIYLPIEGDRLVAYDWERGRQMWIVPSHPVHQPVEGHGLLFVSEAASLKAIRTSDGSTAWERPTPGDLAVPPVWDNGWLMLAAGTGEVLALRALDGELVWRRDLGSRAHAQPSLAADRVYVPVDDGRIVALQVETGEPLWERRLGGPATAILAAGDRLYAGSRDNFFYSIRESDGTVAWRWRTGADVVGLPVTDDRNVYFVSMDNVLRALARGSGVQRWVRLLPLRPTRGPLTVGRTLIVSGVAPSLPAFNMNDGTPAGEVPATGELAGAPIAVPHPSTGLPQVLVVTRDLAKGATATLFTRQLDPPLSPFTPPPNAIQVIPLPGARGE